MVIIKAVQTQVTKVCGETFRIGPLTCRVCDHHSYVVGFEQVYGSCQGGYFSDMTPKGMDVNDEYNKIMARFPKAVKERVRVIMGCFGNSRGSMVSVDDNGQRVEHDLADALRDTIAQRIAQIENPSVYAIGHSWGGWSVMRIVHSLAETIPVRLLVTIDPISYARCGPGEIAGSYFSSYREVATNPECTKAPSDITAPMRKAIAAKTAHWANFYQTGSLWLHSGSITGADVNTPLTELKGSFVNPYKEHMDADNVARIWRAVYEALTKS